MLHIHGMIIIIMINVFITIQLQISFIIYSPLIPSSFLICAHKDLTQLRRVSHSNYGEIHTCFEPKTNSALKGSSTSLNKQVKELFKQALYCVLISVWARERANPLPREPRYQH